MLLSIGQELVQRRNYLPEGTQVETIYFGGGTPSILAASEIEYLLDLISIHFPLALKEVTLEANPDDLSLEKLAAYKKIGIDRLSIGIQSFQEPILRFYNRAHTASDSLRVLDLARSAGFSKLSIDLMYGFPADNHTYWQKDLEMALTLDPGHISSYCLTIERKTALGQWKTSGKFKEATEDFVADEFNLLLDAMTGAGYIQYEISNFGKPGHFALHNTNYWRGVPYLGIGPSAHSFDGQHRGSNVANNARYMKGITSSTPVFQVDILSPEDRANEYLLTALRTIWGVDLPFFRSTFGWDLLIDKEHEIRFLKDNGWLIHADDSLTLSRSGKILADSISAKLFI
ncbi:putative radical SAM family enzyme, NOT coproporphyrinogen III oxidase, oxygen-independent [Lunatimonas lonarensis]|uniref:Heme chaperone HemW n=2 Tax=Lunatimonas lonarensis TaxID=1232681 RepID=R7ZTH5_9BACT|nr:putative radical SAM family enzyme, NOT coproporphyrinogen III oxidase, oxygen-independent [Lunatimonas lonarensis]